MSFLNDLLDKIMHGGSVPPPIATPSPAVIILPPPDNPVIILPAPISDVLGAMATSRQGLAEITGYEGVCTAPYKDSVGVWTFGIGHTRYDGAPIPENMQKGLDHPLEEIFALFQNRIKRYEKDVNNVLTVPVSQAQFDALVSFHYNTGAIGYASLVPTINAGGSKAGITAHFMMYVKGGGRTIQGLVTRRTNEAKLYCTGLYANHGEALVTTADVNGREMSSHARSIDVLPFIS